MKNSEISLSVYDVEDAWLVIANIKRIFFEIDIEHERWFKNENSYSRIFY